MNNRKKIKVGIGFATGRKIFQKVLRTYVYNWFESGLIEKENISLNLLVAYDVKYSNTSSKDYTNVSNDIKDMLDQTYFISKSTMKNEIETLMANGVINEAEAKLFFSSGYAAQRNALLYIAVKNNIDYLIFLDDDEYPVAVTKNNLATIWSGQHVLSTHLENIKNSDITHGYHCGYISPIPFVPFNNTMSESDFRMFIEAISNDILNWDTISSVMKNGGVTYADTNILIKNQVKEVPEINNAKFISGSNLCINLNNPAKVLPFYNPPGARGEDTFLSTCLSNHKVLKVPCYTFHDGFSTYNHLMDGVLPINLKYIKATSDKIIDRFFRACIGWIRYKPLFIYITQRDQYEDKINEMRDKLNFTLPKLCAYFKRDSFFNILKELEYYNKNVEKHYQHFIETQNIWNKIKNHILAENYLIKK